MTDKETNEILEELQGINKLYDYVISDILEDTTNNGYDGENLQEKLMARLGDISHGCQSGTVGSLIYYSDTCAFFKKYKKEISVLIKDYQDQTGSNISDLEWFDKEDIFCEEQNNQNYLAWFAYETIAWELQSRLEE